MEGIKEYVANPSWNTRVLPLDMVTSSSSLIMKFQLILVLCIISCTMYQIQAYRPFLYQEEQQQITNQWQRLCLKSGSKPCIKFNMIKFLMNVRELRRILIS